jgi:hypothetical protein
VLSYEYINYQKDLSYSNLDIVISPSRNAQTRRERLWIPVHVLLQKKEKKKLL